jgi:hypothetical protein
MRNTLFIIAIFSLVLVSAGDARGQCTCAPEYENITAREEFKLADAVFVGKVLAIKNSPRDKDDNYVETVTFQVSEAWKQDLNSTLTITNTIDFCLNGFKENEEWLVYAYKHQDGVTLGSACCCSRTKSLTRAKDDLKTFADDPPAKILRPQNSRP